MNILKNIPNALTISRFAFIPFIVFSTIQGNYVLTILFLTLSGITDILDGAIARKFNLISDFGKLIDPVADKTTQIAVLASLVIKNTIPLWILLVIIGKEFIMVSGASFLYGKELVVSSRWYGKLATVLLYVAMVLSLVIKLTNNYNFSSFLQNIDNMIYYLAIGSSVFSLAMYMKAFYLHGYLKDLKR